MTVQVIITTAAGALLLGVSGWLLTTTIQVQKDTEIIKEKLDKIYADDCPYCVHALHSSLSEHPLLAPTIKRAHIHTPDGQVIYLND